MSVRLMDKKDFPKRKRISTPKIMQTADWLQTQSQLAAGIPPGKGSVMVFSDEELKRLGIRNIRKASQPIKDYIKRLGLPYEVEARSTPEGPTIIIENPAVAEEA